VSLNGAQRAKVFSHSCFGTERDGLRLHQANLFAPVSTVADMNMLFPQTKNVCGALDANPSILPSSIRRTSVDLFDKRIVERE
jgi:hypothetical protein